MRGFLVLVVLSVGCGATETTPSSPAACPTCGPCREAAELARLREKAATDPADVLRSLGVDDDQFEDVARVLYATWRMKHPGSTEPSPVPLPSSESLRTAPATPGAGRVDALGVSEEYTDHYWWCFGVVNTDMRMCAGTGTKCVDFARTLKSSPTCERETSASCALYKKRDGSDFSLCWRTSSQCREYSTLFEAEELRLTSPCVTLVHR